MLLGDFLGAGNNALSRRPVKAVHATRVARNNNAPVLDAVHQLGASLVEDHDISVGASMARGTLHFASTLAMVSLLNSKNAQTRFDAFRE